MFDVSSDATATVIRVVGEIDLATCGILARTIDDASSQHASLVVSFEDCTYVDSSCLGVLIRKRKRLGDALLIVAKPSSQVSRIFAIAGLAEALDIRPSLDAALAAIASA